MHSYYTVVILSDYLSCTVYLPVFGSVFAMGEVPGRVCTHAYCVFFYAPCVSQLSYSDYISI